MNKRLTSIVAGVLATLVFTALAGAASAKETRIKCEGAGICTYAVSGGESRFSMRNNDTVWCTEVQGNGEVTGLNAERESTTGNLQLLFKGCKEQATIFHFACSNSAVTGQITTNVMTVHSINYPFTPQESSVLLTNAGVTFTCAGGFASTQVTGNVIGELETNCGTGGTTTLKVNFQALTDGEQKRQSYTTGTFDLQGKTSHTSGGIYETAAQTGTGTLTFNQNVAVTCS